MHSVGYNKYTFIILHGHTMGGEKKSSCNICGPDVHTWSTCRHNVLFSVIYFSFCTEHLQGDTVSKHGAATEEVTQHTAEIDFQTRKYFSACIISRPAHTDITHTDSHQKELAPPHPRDYIKPRNKSDSYTGRCRSHSTLYATLQTPSVKSLLHHTVYFLLKTMRP